jgi:hypothetical protein
MDATLMARIVKEAGVPEGGAGFVFDLANLLAPAQSLAPIAEAAGTFNGAGVDALSTEAIAWVISLGAATGAPTSFTVQITLQDSNDNGVADPYANAQDFLGNAIQSASLVAGSQALILVERGNRELNANSNFRPSRRFRRAQVVVAFVGGTAPAIPVDVVALVVKRRLPSTVSGLGN